MQLSKQVTSLEISKRLKELGVKQESLFKWHCKIDENCKQATPYELVYFPVDILDIIPAFTVAELGEMLPVGRKSWRFTDFEKPIKTDLYQERWICEQGGHHEEAETEADARGKMLIYLLENSLI